MDQILNIVQYSGHHFEKKRLPQPMWLSNIMYRSTNVPNLVLLSQNAQ
jgi:hypothetical protein